MGKNISSSGCLFLNFCNKFWGKSDSESNGSKACGGFMACLISFFKKKPVQIGILAFLCYIFLFHALGSYRLIDVDEPRYAEAAREMIEKHDWVTPYFNYQLRFDKPVFIYWLIALSYKLFGNVSEFAARFPSALMGSFLVFFTYFFGRRSVSHFFGMVSAVVLLTCLQFIAISRMSITDMTLSFFLCATYFSGFLGLESKESHKKYWWWLAYAFCGLAILTKGPVGFGLPAIIFAVYAVLSGKIKECFKPIYILPGFLIMSLISVPWYYLIIQRHSEFVSYFFIKHNLQRFSSTELGHVQPFYFYIPVVLLGFFPWSVYFVPALVKGVNRLVAFAKEAQPKSLAIFENLDLKNKAMLYSIITFSVIFVFFSASEAKLLTYIMSLFPALAFISADMIVSFFEEGKNSKAVKISTIVLAVVCFLLGLVGLVGFNIFLPRDEKLVAAISSGSMAMILSIFWLVPVVFTALFFKGKKKLSFALIPLMMAGVVMTSVYKVMPVVYNAGPKDLYNYVKFASLPAYKNNPIATYDLVKPTTVFYAQRKVPVVTTREEVSKLLESKGVVLIIVKNKRLHDETIEGLNYHVVHSGVKYTLISNKKITDFSEME